MTMIAVYRALSGPHYQYSSEFVAAGFDETSLRERGICNNNGNPAQNSLHHEEWSEYGDPYVPGLPVFLNWEEAESRLRNARIKHTERGLGAIACAEIPERQIKTGRIQIRSNVLMKDFTRPITFEELIAHRDGFKKIDGECYIANFPRDKKGIKTIVFIPRAHLLDGAIDSNLAESYINLSQFH